MAEVAIPRSLFDDILRLIAELRPPPARRSIVVPSLQTMRVVRLYDNETRISGARRPMSPACVHGSPCVEELELPKNPKSVESGHLSLAKAVIRSGTRASALPLSHLFWRIFDKITTSHLNCGFHVTLPAYFTA
jgi:hypothetical protein